MVTGVLRVSALICAALALSALAMPADRASAQAGPILSADIEIDGPGAVAPGGIARYQVKITNLDPQRVVTGIAAGFQNPLNAAGNYAFPAYADFVVAGAGCTFTASRHISCPALGQLAPGQTLAFIVQFNIKADAPCNSSFAFSGDVVSNEAARNWFDVVQTIITCPQQTDLSVMKSGPATAVPGGVIKYDVWAVHGGGATASNVVIQDTIPAGLTFNAQQSDAACAQVGNTVECKYASLSALDMKVGGFIVFNVPASAACGSQISNVATVKSDNPDPNAGNNSTTIPVTSTVTCATAGDLTVSKTAASATVTRGGSIIYTVTVTNAGTSSATNVTVSDPVPAALSFTPTGSDPSCSLQGNNVVCSLGTVNGNQSRTVAIAFNAPVIAGCTQTTAQNVAYVSSNPADQNTANNQSQPVSTTVLCDGGQGGGQLTVTKTDGRSTVAPGETLTYTIVLSNSGNAALGGLTVVDTLPGELTYVSASHGPSVNGQVVTWANLSVNAHSSLTLTLQARVRDNVTSGTVIRNTLQVTGATVVVVPEDSSTVQPQNPSLGCIDVIKETFDTSGAVLTPVTQFTFTLDGGAQVQNDGSGRARFANVTPGYHVVTETLPATWSQLSVTPVGGSVNVSAGGTCATVTFKNKQSIGGPNGSFQCDNGRDDDGDGLVDYPADPGCSSRTDDNELNLGGPGPHPCRHCNDDDYGHTSFTDVPYGSWYYSFVVRLEARGIISGYKDEYGNPLYLYRPNNRVTYAELAKMVLELAGEDVYGVYGLPRNWSARSHWSEAYIKRAEDLGFAVYQNSSLDVNRSATRAEVVQTIVDALRLTGYDDGYSYSDVHANHRYYHAIVIASSLGIVTGDDGYGTFRPDSHVNRAEIAAMLIRALDVYIY